ncbi:snf2 super family [Chrysochromulina tobinii]|uniref:Snf2 super family n=1 Tax=Chrysochromulina tobinii TaxID=1460289 RepID=A0A0M0JYF1_9EUKA|nr:snf2 super family [Chrysochromulina tobinii]|eukprot:KOO31585.1 snf2 super family [Chrysochromulina sp. CCMP291]
MCIKPGCKAPAHPSCVISVAELGNEVADALKEQKVAAVMLVGTPLQRSSIIDNFQQLELKAGEPRVLLLNLRDESAAGANLTAASHAIFVHPLLVGSQQEYTSCDTQAVGRVRRYGQSRTVQLYRFLVANSIDEDIFRDRRAADAEVLLASAASGDKVRPIE